MKTASSRSGSAAPIASLFAFAGIWASLEVDEGEELIHSCSIVTCEPNRLLRPIHDRMPVILAPEAEAAWLDVESDPAAIADLLRPAPEDMLGPRCERRSQRRARGRPELLDPPLKLF